MMLTFAHELLLIPSSDRSLFNNEAHCAMNKAYKQDVIYYVYIVIQPKGAWNLYR